MGIIKRIKKLLSKKDTYFFEKSASGDIHLCFEKDGKIISVARSTGHSYGLMHFCKTHGIPFRFFKPDRAWKDFSAHVKEHPNIFQ